MKRNIPNKRKIINDPVYGFINIPTELVFDVLEHPYVQRLRRIKQLGLAYLVYPGAIHTRFQHVLGAMHLIGLAIDVIRSKGHEITEAEAEAVTIAILLHDVGHGPFSHTLEHCIIEDITHEELSILFMERMNVCFDGRLSLAIEIFKNQYHKSFLHQLVSSQLDMDRLDYLKRDSFFTGVSEGVISSDRIIKMLNVVDDQLVVEAKGIYSIEKFLIARRLMYWQVYLHKTSLAADQILIKILQRAKHLAAKKDKLFCTPAFEHFLYKSVSKADFTGTSGIEGKTALDYFSMLDDEDVMASIKVWSTHPDFVLSTLCCALLNRKLFHIELQKKPFTASQLKEVKEKVCKLYSIGKKDGDYFVATGFAANSAYYVNDEKINILYNSGELVDVTNASDMFNLSVIAKTEKKYFLCCPKYI